MAFIDCAGCGARNSAFNPRCIGCGKTLAAGDVPARAAASAKPAQAGGAWSGRTIDGYEVVAAIASGSSGDVVRARAHDGRDVVLKILRSELAGDPELRSRIAREARALAAIESPFVARILGTLSSQPGLVLEHLVGTSLEASLARARPTSQAALAILADVADGLAALHAAGVVHRDLKPANIILEATGPATPAKIIDLGLVRFLEARPGTLRTAIGTVLGTLAYSAPEVVLGEAPTPAADLFSLGVVAYEVFAGNRPFEGPTRRALATAILSGEAPPLDAPPRLRGLVRDLLAKEPGHRPPDAVSVASALRALRVDSVP